MKAHNNAGQRKVNALKRLETQLEKGTKQKNPKSAIEPLTDADKKRIASEITILRQRV